MSNENQMLFTIWKGIIAASLVNAVFVERLRAHLTGQTSREVQETIVRETIQLWQMMMGEVDQYIVEWFRRREGGQQAT